MGNKNGGFAGMDPVKHRELCARGGKAVPGEKRSFSKDRLLASMAGRMGGQAVPKEKRSFSTNRELARESGRKGGTPKLPANVMINRPEDT